MSNPYQSPTEPPPPPEALAAKPSAPVPAGPLGGSGRGWSVVAAGLGVNLALGILYSWSVISKAVPADWGWGESEKSLPYSVACLVFSLTMPLAGLAQDRIGPRWTTTLGGVLGGLGLILASLSTWSLGYTLGFGLLTGIGLGLAYASTTPAAVKWFPKRRTGAIAGLVVAGFGLASVYIAPLTKVLADEFGLPRTVLVLGIGFLAVVVVLAQALAVPRSAPAASASDPKSPTPPFTPAEDWSPAAMATTLAFAILWLMYAFGSGAGLMIIGKLATIAKVQAGLEGGFLLVAMLAVGNGGGRVLAGLLSDRFGSRVTLVAVFLIQAALIGTLSLVRVGGPLANLPVLIALSVGMGAAYGANLALFPALTRGWFGVKHLGANYGLVFTAWGVGGFVLPLVAGMIFDATKAFTWAYVVAVVLLIAGAGLGLIVRQPHRSA